MGKSNKFDYTNRPNSGEKLGQIIGRDLSKEADKVLKDAQKQATKLRKTSTGSTASSSSASVDARDSVVHTLDIKTPGKQLGDEGACAMAAGLEVALRKGTDEASVLLEDLDLSDNGITTVSLERLAPAIALASRTLKNVNLANNLIKVVTDDEAAEWETFLHAFTSCTNLRELNLLNNPSLGARAMEILARVHVHEEPIRPKASQMPIRHLIEEQLEDNEPTPKAATFGEAAFRMRRKGLRSLPFLVLNNTGLDDTGALWLSYVIEDHYYPSQLSDEINNISDADALGAAKQGMHYTGIQWEGGDHQVGKDGLYLLRKAETIRQQTFLTDASNAGSDSVSDTGPDGEKELACSGKTSIARRHSRANRGDRRDSIRSNHTSDVHNIPDLDSVRKKIQRSIIDKHGAARVELWRTGLLMATSARILQVIGPESRDMTRFYIGPPIFDFTEPPKPINTRPVTPNSTTRRKKKETLRQGTYAATLTADSGATAGEPELVITEVTNSPTTPKMIFKPHRKHAFSDGGDLQLAQKLVALLVRDEDPWRFIRFQEKRIEEAAEEFRDSKIPSHLPASVVERIAGFAVAEREKEGLSDQQRERVMAWGRDRSRVVELEREWRKMADSAQVWMFLESIACLEYQRE